MFKEKTIFYILLLITFTAVPQSDFTSTLDKYLVSQDTIIEEKFNGYASEQGKESLDSRYAEGYKNNNFKYRIFVDLRNLTNLFAVPFLLFILFYNRQKLKACPKLFSLFHVSIACLAVTHLMLNVSQGERFYLISGFLILGTYFYYIQILEFKTLKLRFPLYFVLPIILLNNIFSLVLVKTFTSIEFIGSNFPLYLFRMVW